LRFSPYLYEEHRDSVSPELLPVIKVLVVLIHRTRLDGFPVIHSQGGISVSFFPFVSERLYTVHHSTRTPRWSPDSCFTLLSGSGNRIGNSRG
jgi:hypothetical protein